MITISNEFILLIHIFITAFAVIIAHKLGEKTLVAFVAVSMVMANLFVTKQVAFYGLTATTADALAIGAMLGLNMLQEFYSRESARQAIGITFCISIFFALSSQIHLLYIPAACDTAHAHFEPLLACAPALVIDSMIVYVYSQLIDFALYGTLQRIWQRKFLVLRNYICIGISQFADTFLFTLWLKWLGIIESVAHVVFVSFIIKFVITLIATPIIAFAAREKTS